MEGGLKYSCVPFAKKASKVKLFLPIYFKYDQICRIQQANRPVVSYSSFVEQNMDYILVPDRYVAMVLFRTTLFSKTHFCVFKSVIS